MADLAIYEIPLKAIPHQEFSFSVSELDCEFSIRIKQLKKILIMDLIKDGEVIIFKGLNCKANTDLLSCLKHKANMFLFFDSLKENFTYNDFDNTTRLYYAIS